MSTGNVTTVTVLGLVETLRHCRLLSAAQLEAVRDELPRRFTDPRALGAELLKRGWLTAYQFNQIFQGRAAQLLLEPYVVLERLGEGGTGQVFKARHLHMQRIAALKIIRKELLTDGEVLQRFYREIEVASQVSHPNVVHAYDAGPVGANHMLVMEYIEGVDLQRRVKESGPLALALACDYARQAALGLQHIHERGLVHRDIKPSNLLIADSPDCGLRIADCGLPGKGTDSSNPQSNPQWKVSSNPQSAIRNPQSNQSAIVKILDLGLARLLPSNARQGHNQLTQLGSGMMGTPDYMAPEQAISLSNVDIRADIYSLGCTWFYLLTGQPPYPGGSLPQKLMRHQQAPIPSVRQWRPELPKSLDGILGRMLAKNPNERYATPGAVAQELGALVSSPQDIHVSNGAPQPTPRKKEPVSYRWLFTRRKLQIGGLVLLLLAGLAGLLLLRSPAVGADFYVAADGSDTAPGTKGKPFASLARARDAVRDKVRAGLQKDVLVLVRGATYALREPLVFGPEDCGTEQHSITYAAFPGEKPVFSGGKPITGWKPAAGKLWTVELPDVKAGQWYFRQLFVNDQRGIRARTPNLGDSASYARLSGSNLSNDLKSWQLGVPKEQLQNWKNIGDVEVVVIKEWELLRKRLQGVDPATGVFTLAPPHPQKSDSTHPRAGLWCYFENAAEMLDQPGEWYLDRTTGVLSYWPLPGQDMNKAESVAPLLNRLLEVKGIADRPVRNLHFKGLRFSHAEEPLPPFGYEGIQATHFAVPPGQPVDESRVRAAVEWTFAENCSLQDGEISHASGTGLSLRQGCVGNLIQGNHFWDLGGSGVNVGLLEDSAKHLPKNNQVSNNYIHACGQVFAALGIWVGFSENTSVTHNYLHDLPYTGISVGWQWNPKPTGCKGHRIEHNHIHDVMNLLADGGGIYTLGAQPGTVLRGNLIHDVHYSTVAQQSPGSNNGIFIDEGSKGFRVEQNTIYNTAGEAIRFNQSQRDWHSWGDNSLRGRDANFGAVLVPGKVGKARAFRGGSDHVEVPHDAALEPPQLTLEAWVQLSAFPTGGDNRRWIVSKNANEWAQGHYGLVIDGKKVGAYVNIGGGAENCFGRFTGDERLTLKEWHHLAMTYDGAELKVYHNGAEAASLTVKKARIAGSGPLSIAGRPDHFVYFQGSIDEVRLYQRPLTATEIKAHHEKPGAVVAKDEKGLVRFWSFDEVGQPPTPAATGAGLEPAYRKALLGEASRER